MNKTDSILFFPEAAVKLNCAVSRRVGHHLFLICNYSPDRIKVFGEDARFMAGVLNLYKMVIDASIIMQIPSISKACSIPYEETKMKDCVDTITFLRTAVSHNVSDRNGTGDCQEKYDEWLRKVTGKEQITCEEDYEKAVDELERIGTRVHNILHRFIQNASRCLDKKRLIRFWEKTILDYYSKSANERIFLGQMREAYISRCRNGYSDEKRMKKKIAQWFQNYYCGKDEEFIASLEGFLKERRGRLNGKDLQKINRMIEHTESELNKKKQKIADVVCYGNISYLTAYSYQEYYLKDLRRKLEEVLEEIRISDDRTMLPEDMMQQLIWQDFKEVGSYDFEGEE